MLEVAHHQRDVYLDGQEDQDPLANRAEQVAGEVDHAEHDDQGDEQVLQSVREHLVHQRFVEHCGDDADHRQDHRTEDSVEKEFLLRPQQVDVPLQHAVLAFLVAELFLALTVVLRRAVDTGGLFRLAALELGSRVQQQQHAGKVFIELIKADLLKVFCRVADDHGVLAFVLLGLIGLAFLFLLHMLVAGGVVLDGGLFEDHHEVCHALIRNNLCDTGKRKIT